MKTFLQTSSLIKLSMAAVSSLLLVSCGSSRDTAYADNDGIYNSSVKNQSEDEKNYYQQYFRTKAQQYEKVSDTDDLIFTDVENYSSTGYIDENGNIQEEYNGYAGWGDNTTEVTVNVYPSYNYDYYWYRPHWWYYSGWGMSYWGGYYGPAWYWSWYYPSYYYGWGWHWGGHHHHHYYYPYYGGYDNYVVYNRGRRNTDFIYRGTGSRNFETSGRNNYSQRETTRRTNNTNYTRNNSVNTRSNSIIRNSNNSSRNNSVINRNNNTGRNNSVINRNTNSGRNNSVINRNTNNSNRNSTINNNSSGRNSGSYNSGGNRSSGNSSGTRSGGSSGRGGRG